MNVKQHFSDLKSTLENRNSKITEVLAYCQKETARINGRYSEAVAAEKLAQLETDAQSTILRHDTEARDKAERIVERLKEALAEHITTSTDTGLLAQLQSAKSFGLKLTHSEIEAMGTKAGGDPVTLACLAQIADQAGFELTFTTTAQLEKDLTSIMAMFPVPSFYTPDEYFHEALTCHPNRRYNGTDWGRPDTTVITVGMGLGKAVPRDLEQIAARWSDASAVTIKQIAAV